MDFTTSSTPSRDVNSVVSVLGMKAISQNPVPVVGRGKLTFSKFLSNCFRRPAFFVVKTCSSDCRAACLVTFGAETGELGWGNDEGTAKGYVFFKE